MIEKQNVADAFQQYQEGAITYVEFVRYAASQATEQDVADHNQFQPPWEAYRPTVPAQWPFTQGES